MHAECGRVDSRRERFRIELDRIIRRQISSVLAATIQPECIGVPRVWRHHQRMPSPLPMAQNFLPKEDALPEVGDGE